MTKRGPRKKRPGYHWVYPERPKVEPKKKKIGNVKRDVLKGKVFTYFPTYLHSDVEMSIFLNDEIFCHLVGKDFDVFVEIMRKADIPVRMRISYEQA